MAALHANPDDQDFIFYLPLVIYAVLITSSGNMDFMTPWAIVSLALPVTASVNRIHQDEKKYARTRPPS
jgi:hypothetical protein